MWNQSASKAAVQGQSEHPTIIKFEDYRDAVGQVRQRQRSTAYSPSDKGIDDPDQTSVLGQYIPLIYHYNMLQDEDRVTAFETAINLVVQPGMHVLELGGGTGILSSFAARRGAEVSCVEHNPELVDCAKRFISANGLDRSVKVIEADAYTYVPPRPVDVVICEMLHVGLLREKQAQVITRFKQNYADHYADHHTDHRGASMPVFIPEASILMAQPVQQSFEFHGYNAPLPMFHAPTLNQPRTLELAPLSAYANISYDQEIPTRFDVHRRDIVEYAGNYNAVRFVTQNVLTVDMQRSAAITWPNQCLVMPLSEQRRCFPGDEVEISFGYEAGGSVESLMRAMDYAFSAPMRQARA